ncbi:MAG: thioredoxin-dependent thiol peroxidase [Patescibacteria group bacterium]
MKAPDFNLPDQEGKLHSLSDYKGKWLILYFYPKDFTPVCTKEDCSFRDGSQEFAGRGVGTIGISKDTVASHKKFAEKYKLNFPILSDPEHKVIEAYGAWGKKNFMGREYYGTIRNTVLINPEGEIVKEYKKVNPLTHTHQILASIDKIISR